MEPISRLAPREQDRIERIVSLTKHRHLLKESLRQARNRVLIISPYISIRALEDDNLLEAFADTVKRNVAVKVLIGSDMDLDPNGVKRANAARAIEALQAIGIDISEVPRIHQKTLVMDERRFVEGSFNWLSAVRDETSVYQRDERSLAYEGPGAVEHIQRIWADVEAAHQ